jgi:hypothetical protein
LDGWHLPAEEKWNDLIAFAGGKKTAGLNIWKLQLEP